jgi:hypothetical protein
MVIWLYKALDAVGATMNCDRVSEAGLCLHVKKHATINFLQGCPRTHKTQD